MEKVALAAPRQWRPRRSARRHHVNARFWEERCVDHVNYCDRLNLSIFTMGSIARRVYLIHEPDTRRNPIDHHVRSGAYGQNIQADFHAFNTDAVTELYLYMFETYLPRRYL